MSMKWKLYEFAGKGMALGTTVVVSANRRDQAERIAKKWAMQNKVDPDGLRLVEQRKVELPAVVYSWDGDY